MTVSTAWFPRNGKIGLDPGPQVCITSGVVSVVFLML